MFPVEILEKKKQGETKRFLGAAKPNP